MGSIRVSPRDHHEAGRPTREEQEKRNKLLAQSALTRACIKEAGKGQSGCPTPQDEREPTKSHDKAEESTPKFPSMIDEIQNFLRGDIEWPVEFDKFISEDPKPTEVKISQTAWLAHASAYIAMHLKRWADEKVVDEIEYAYKTMSIPFTGRVLGIKTACEDLLNVLPGRLPAFQQRFREKYEKLLSVANKADNEHDNKFNASINSFKFAAGELHGIVSMILSEALVAMENLTQPANGEGPQGDGGQGDKAGDMNDAQGKDGQGDTQPDDTPTVTEYEVKVLNYLNDEYPKLLSITEISEGISKRPTDRKLIRGHLGTLVSKELVKAKTVGKRAMYAATKKGKGYIDKYFS